MNSITIFIIGLNVYFSYKGFNDPVFFNKYKFNPSYIKKGEKIRYISSAFLHVDTTHLIVNMFTLYFFIDSVIYRVGSISFLIIYFASLIFGNWITYRINQNKLNYNAVGASGAVGRMMIQVLSEQNWFDLRNFELELYASVRSKGLLIPFRGQKFQVQEYQTTKVAQCHFILMSAGQDFSTIEVPKLLELGAIVIDNSSAWRMNPEVPLVVPEVNAQLIKKNVQGQVIANPNCVVAQNFNLLKLHQELFIDTEPRNNYNEKQK